jgi:5-methylcytosine-specific restriction endonuclease McrA
MEIIDTTFCSKCREEKLTEEFSWRRKAKGTLQLWCKACAGIAYKKWATENPEKVAAGKKKWARANPEKTAVSSKKWQQANPERVITNGKKWVQANLGKLNAKTNRRRITKLHRTPSWSECKAIRRFYINCPKGMEVDHIIPLQGKKVSGLHVLSNLQYLTPKKNQIKHNKFDPLDPDKWNKSINPNNFKE